MDLFGEASRHLLRVYADYYNRTRTHLSLNKDSPAYYDDCYQVRRVRAPYGWSWRRVYVYDYC
jgi:hypothetical protein